MSIDKSEGPTDSMTDIMTKTCHEYEYRLLQNHPSTSNLPRAWCRKAQGAWIIPRADRCAEGRCKQHPCTEPQQNHAPSREGGLREDFFGAVSSRLAFPVLVSVRTVLPWVKSRNQGNSSEGDVVISRFEVTLSVLREQETLAIKTSELV